MSSLKVFSCSMLAFLFISNVSVVAQDKPPQSSASYKPSLSDMMAAIQLRHSKLWYAGKLKNWPLADYELGHLSASIKEVTRLYPNTPASDMTGTDKLAVLIGESIKEKSDAKFEKSFARMTTECNGCHVAADRAFIYIRTPVLPSPYSNQAFAPRKR